MDKKAFAVDKVSKNTRYMTRRSLTIGAAIAASVTSPCMRPLKVKANTTKSSLDGPWTDEGHVAVGGGNVHWVSMGEGEPLVLLHKLGGWVADWRHVAPSLAQKYRVIAIDTPGHGESVMHGPPPFLQTLGESASMLMAALDAMDIKKCKIVGCSLGGCIAVVAAALWPERVSKLVLLSVALGQAATRSELEELERYRVASSFDDEGRPQPRNAAFDENRFPLPRDFEPMAKLFGFRDRSIHEEQNASRAKAGSWVAASEIGVGRAGVVDYLARIQAPTLLIYGERGGYKQFEAPGKAGINDVRSLHIADAGSFTHQDNPEVTAKVLVDFFG